MANLTVSADIDAFMASANNAAARTSLNVPESPASYAGDFTGSNSASLPGTFGVTTGDFTVEVFINRLGNSGVGHILCDQLNGLVLYSNGANIYFSQTGGLTVVSGALSVDSNWHHVAAVRESGTASLYVDGTRISTASDSTDFTTSGAAEIGQLFSQSGGNFIGEIGSVRISNIARYSGATCTVPTVVFVSDVNTLNLFLQSVSLDATLTPHPSVAMVSGTLSGVFVAESRTLTAGTGLTGGGDLSADRAFAVAYGTSAGTAAEGNDSRITGAAKSADVQVFTSSGTWTKPAGAKSVKVQLLAGGGGGGAGRKDSTSATVRCGGGGGGGGSLVNITVPAALLGATETVTIGAGGNGAAGQATDVSNGSPGSAGTATSFGSNVVANGGSFGGGGSPSSGAAGSGVMQGNNGASASITGAGGVTGNPSAVTSAAQPGGAGGAAGAGITTANVPSAGAAGGRSLIAGLAGGLAGATGAAGSAGNANTLASTGLCVTGSGGGSGGSGVGVSGGAGGAGGFPAAGGAGGGATAFASGTSGAGGAGGAGMAVITTYF